MEQITINEFELWKLRRSRGRLLGMWNIHHDTNPFEGGGFQFMVHDLHGHPGTMTHTQQCRLYAIVIATRVKQVFILCKRPSEMALASDHDRRHHHQVNPGHHCQIKNRRPR